MSPPAVASTSPTDPRLARVEVLYFDGCPNHEPVVDRVRELLGAERHPSVIELVNVGSDAAAQACRFLGSPTVRVDGADIEPGADQRTDYGLKCRLYRTPAGLAGMPDDAALLAALNRTSQRHQAPAAALARLGLTEPRSERVAALDPSHRQLYQRILARFAAGDQPSSDTVRDSARQLGLDPTALEALRSIDLIQTDPDGSVIVAYPFSARPTNHCVIPGGGPALSAMCAIDALAIPFMLDRPAVIHSTDPAGRVSIELHVDPARGTIEARPPDAVVVAATSGQACSAFSCCPFINFAASPAHSERYLAQHPELTGETLALGLATDIARCHFGGLGITPTAATSRESAPPRSAACGCPC